MFPHLSEASDAMQLTTILTAKLSTRRLVKYVLAGVRTFCGHYHRCTELELELELLRHFTCCHYHTPNFHLVRHDTSCQHEVLITRYVHPTFFVSEYLLLICTRSLLLAFRTSQNHPMSAIYTKVNISRYLSMIAD